MLPPLIYKLHSHLSFLLTLISRDGGGRQERGGELGLEGAQVLLGLPDCQDKDCARRGYHGSGADRRAFARKGDEECGGGEQGALGSGDEACECVGLAGYSAAWDI